MKRIVALVFVSLAVAFLSLGQDQQGAGKSIEESLIKLEKESWEAWKKRDGKFFQSFLSDDHVEVGSNGPASKAIVVAFVGSPVCVIKSYSIDKFKVVTFAANTAVLTYYAEQDTSCNGKAVPSPVWVSSLYVKRDGRWRNALYQQTPTGK